MWHANYCVLHFFSGEWEGRRRHSANIQADVRLSYLLSLRLAETRSPHWKHTSLFDCFVRVEAFCVLTSHPLNVWWRTDWLAAL